MKVRGVADSQLQVRFKDEETFAKYDPSGEQAKEIYHELEIARCELLGKGIILDQRRTFGKKQK